MLHLRLVPPEGCRVRGRFLRRVLELHPYQRSASSATGRTPRASSRTLSTASEPAEPLESLRGRPRKYPGIRTLDPAKLTAEDHIILGKRRASTKFIYAYSRFSPTRVRIDLPDSGLLQGPYSESHGSGDDEPGGFLYFHRYPCAPPLSGEIRLRLTTSNDPSTFPSGVDYTSARGVPWCIPLLAVAAGQMFYPFVHLLTSVDGLVSQRVMDIAMEDSHRFITGHGHHGSRSLHAFGQPFDLPLDHYKHSFSFIGTQHVSSVAFKKLTMFRTNRLPVGFEPLAPRRPEYHAPFLGTLLCCFEPSPLPQHAGKHVVVIRVIRALDAVRPNPSYSGPSYPLDLMPQDGQLLKCMYHRKVKTWTGDADKPSRPKGRSPAASLSILFENAVEYGSWPLQAAMPHSPAYESR
ncbi:hypothetical protein L226DRAFT_311436 [Lentinus tigrinus ALCF2SS1-7]|uniref:Uncharacterized protein n=1 Tax=Lentinus tigrinus ALCF2SS1-6 TaxID=1328759 RepID=A0A5C2S514_9APHY|nr:hypothetical protein L227DRAFT_174854 [Lentinus tigrinus ALCF2SS1-6]RPD68953.1 hypothetical protein L226DRAFT_311436 [Lentinus tigrinus ALCF2SS1-7]